MQDQLLRSLEWILKSEPDLPGVEKWFVLNRVCNNTHVKIVKQMVKRAGHKCLEIPFIAKEYQSFQPTDTLGILPQDLTNVYDKYSLRRFERQNANLYLMNNNGARNFALKHGLEQGYVWTLPLDGNCYFDKATSWDNVVNELKVASLERKSYAVFPLERTSFDLDGNVKRSGAMGEHQIAFALAAKLKYNPMAMYSFRPKIDLLYRLGVPGIWDRWPENVFTHTSACITRGSTKAKTVVDHEKVIQKGFPIVCFGERDLARKNVAEAALTMVSDVPILRLPDRLRTRNTSTAGEGVQSRASRQQLRDLAILNRVRFVDYAELSVHERAHYPSKAQKPLFFNVASMEILRRMYLVGEKNSHTLQLMKLIEFARAELAVDSDGIGTNHLRQPQPVPTVHKTIMLHSLAYFYSNDRRFSDKGLTIARQWLAETRSIKSDFGLTVINAILTLDAVGLLKQSAMWIAADTVLLKRWCKRSSQLPYNANGASDGWLRAIWMAALEKCNENSDSVVRTLIQQSSLDWSLLAPKSMSNNNVESLILLWRAALNLGIGTEPIFVALEANMYNIVRLKLLAATTSVFDNAAVEIVSMCLWLKDVAVSRRSVPAEVKAFCCDVPAAITAVLNNVDGRVSSFSHFMF
jgi:hypothetical protein